MLHTNPKKVGYGAENLPERNQRSHLPVLVIHARPNGLFVENALPIRIINARYLGGIKPVANNPIVLHTDYDNLYVYYI